MKWEGTSTVLPACCAWTCLTDKKRAKLSDQWPSLSADWITEKSCDLQNVPRKRVVNNLGPT
jgi:hypothetical protein